MMTMTRLAVLATCARRFQGGWYVEGTSERYV